MALKPKLIRYHQIEDNLNQLQETESQFVIKALLLAKQVGYLPVG